VYIDKQIQALGIFPTEAETAFHFYCQLDRNYNSDKSVCWTAHWGCGVTSTAMVLTSFGDAYTPKALGLKFGFGCERATFPKDITNVLNTFGYVHQSIYIPSTNRINISAVRTFTQNGYYVIVGACMVCEGCKGPTQHTTVVLKVNDDNTFEDADPMSCRSDSNYHLRTLDPTYPGPDIKSGCPDGDGWFWAYAVKKP
jgi:hypothetical protein